jgi:hypothetical protein
MVKKLVIFMMFCVFALPLMAGTEDQTDRLRSFISFYCKTYENRDLNKLKMLFASNATENNIPFHKLLPKYTRNMEMVESFNYYIELVGYSLQPDTGNVNIKGKFFTKYRLHGGTWKENSGNISLELIESDESYLVKRLDYSN